LRRIGRGTDFAQNIEGGLHVRAAIGQLRSADRDKQDFRLASRRADRSDEVHALAIALEQIQKSGFKEGELTTFKEIHASRVGIDAGNAVSGIGKANACDQSHITRPHHAYVHGSLLSTPRNPWY